MPRPLAREAEELPAVEVRAATLAPNSATAAIALTHLWVGYLDVPIAIARSAVVVSVMVAAVMLRDAAAPVVRPCVVRAMMSARAVSSGRRGHGCDCASPEDHRTAGEHACNSGSRHRRSFLWLG